MSYRPDINVIVLIGQIPIRVTNTGSEVTFETETGESFKMYHDQDCCESVAVESIVGNLDALIGSPILAVEEVISTERPADVPKPESSDDSETWTTFKITNTKGTVTIHWLGSSNGYYSESVSFTKVS
jgi:hypothetical protein